MCLPSNVSLQNNLGLAGPKSGTRNFIWVSHMGKTQALGSFLCPHMLAGIGSRAASFGTCTAKWDTGVIGGHLTCAPMPSLDCFLVIGLL